MKERIAIIDHATHSLYIEDVDTSIIEREFNGEEERYIEHNHKFQEGYSWDYITRGNHIVHNDGKDRYRYDLNI